MQRQQFFDLIGPLGVFHCQQDRRRTGQRVTAPLGHCRPGEHHHCEFDLHAFARTQIGVVGYQRPAEVAGHTVRMRSNSFTYWGRGRRWHATGGRKKK